MSIQQPVLFLGHGSPMVALDTAASNPHVAAWVALRDQLPTPRAILVISAHWETQGVRLMADARPKTIHDFYGFPELLNAMTYDAPGAPELAASIKALVPELDVAPEGEWGLDHGAWSLLVHLYPKANIPILQLGLNKAFTLKEHLALGQRLAPLRDQGILILGSGNIVHNLGEINWRDPIGGHPWGVAFDAKIAEALEQRADTILVEQPPRRVQPTIEHYLPLLYAYGASNPQDSLSYPLVGMTMGSLSMRAALWSPR